MNNAYCNMAGPPRSRIQKVMRAIGRQLVFSFDAIREISKGDNLNWTKEKRNALIQRQLTDYVRQHQAELDGVRRPRGFMVGRIFDSLSPIEDERRRDPDVYRRCRDPILTLAVLGRMAGTLYVPRREIRLSCDDLGCGRAIAFPEKYFADCRAVGDLS